MKVGDKLQALAALPPGKENFLVIEPDAGWISEPVWMLGTRQKYDACCGSQTATEMSYGVSALHYTDGHAVR
jgi:hypothetical protein